MILDDGRSVYAFMNGVLVGHGCVRCAPHGVGIIQVVITVQLRRKVWKIAHDNPDAGHLGTQNTLDRLIKKTLLVAAYKFESTRILSYV